MMELTLGLQAIFILAVFHQVASDGVTYKAKCTITADTGDASVPLTGTITLTQEGDDDTEIIVKLTGINNTADNDKRGFHVHAVGETGNMCADATGHYNPFNMVHGGPTDEKRHVGDLGNIMIDANGNVDTTMTDTLVKLSGANSVIGKAIVVHAGEDDLGKGGDSGSTTTGNAGPRLGCCVIMEIKTVKAKCTINADTGDASVPLSGTVTLTQEGDDDTEIMVKLTGINNTAANSKRGFHVHAEGQTGNKCTDAKGHYNPFTKVHGGPADVERHVGDLGNIMIDANGNVDTTMTDTLVKLSGATSVIGKAIVVHAGEDDLGTGGDAGSTTTGNAGPRLGCCVIMAMDDSKPDDVKDLTDGSTSLCFMASMFGITLLLSLLFANN